MSIRDHARRGLRSGLLVGAALLPACESTRDPVDPVQERPVPTAIRISPSSVRLVIPASTDLHAAVSDQNGRDMSGQAITFASRDTTTATVSASGRVTAVRSGLTWVVASSGTLRDSAAVETRYHVVDGAAVGRIRGDGDILQSWEAGGADLDFMRTHEQDRLVLSMEDYEWPYTTMILVLPDLATGTRQLAAGSAQRYAETDFVLDLPVDEAYLVMRARDGTSRVYPSLPGSRIDVDSVEAAQGWGLRGVVRGRIVFRGVGSELSHEYGGEPPTVRFVGDTVDVVVDFAAEYLWWAVGQAAYTITGGPVPDSLEGLEAWWVNDDDHLDGSRGRLQIENGTSDVDVLLPWPEVGTFPLDSVGVDQPPSAVDRALEAYGPGQYFALGTGGSITFTQVIPPDGDRWGLVSGTATSRLAWWSWSQHPPAFVDTATIELQFDAIVTWGEGPPAAPLARAQNAIEREGM